MICNNIHIPIVGCLHPRVITNTRGQKVLVPCGHCKACLTRKSNIYTQLCELESLSYPDSLFVTLTYNNINLPRLQPVHDRKNLRSYYYLTRTAVNSNDEKDFYDLCEKNGSDCPYQCEDFFDNHGYLFRQDYLDPNQFDKHVYNLELLKTKFGSDLIPCLYQPDLRRFLYKLRQYFKRNNYGTLRYFAVGEYGPVHYRPHYHLLLWTENRPQPNQGPNCYRNYVADRWPEKMDKVISSLWNYGYSYTEFTKGPAAHYVAGYTSSYSCVPSILRESPIEPFNTHSQFLGRRFFENRRNEIYDGESPDSIRKFVAKLGNDIREIIPPSGIQAAFFPRFYGYHAIPDEMRYHCYVLYDWLRQYYDRENGFNAEVKVSDLSRFITEDLFQKEFETEKETLSSPTSYQGVLNFFAALLYDSFPNWHQPYLENYQYAKDFISRFLYVSKHFIEFCCDNNPSNYKTIFNKIIEFYKYQEQTQLDSFFDFQSKIKEDSSYLYKYLYDDSFNEDTYMTTNLYKWYDNKVSDSFHNKIKHRELNDANNIFNNL